jgi:L-rhamnose mutarotase
MNLQMAVIFNYFTVMKRYCLALDLVDDPLLIEEYEHWHKSDNAWPEIKKSISDSGITNMEIYRLGNRLFMTLFPLSKKLPWMHRTRKCRNGKNLCGSFKSHCLGLSPEKNGC